MPSRSDTHLLDAVVRLHPHAGVQRVGGVLLAVSAPNLQHTFEHGDGAPSEVAERIVALADGRRTVAAIVDALCDEFEVERERCAADTVAFVERLLAHQLFVIEGSR